VNPNLRPSTRVNPAKVRMERVTLSIRTLARPRDRPVVNTRHVSASETGIVQKRATYMEGVFALETGAVVV